MWKTVSRRLQSSVRLPLFILCLMWGIQAVQSLARLDLGILGVYPRRVEGLWGVLLSPLVHGGFGHLLSNSIPLFVLSALVLFFYRRVALPAIGWIYLLTGVLVWTFGRPVYHVGASGVVYGLVAFVFWTGVFRRNFKSIALAGLVLFYYGSMFIGILPGEDGISWESHLLGAGAGVVVAFWYKDKLEYDEQRRILPEEEEASRYFLERDTFEKKRGG
jgi:membrane associated rhomboid family serine protease